MYSGKRALDETSLFGALEGDKRKHGEIFGVDVVVTRYQRGPLRKPQCD